MKARKEVDRMQQVIERLRRAGWTVAVLYPACKGSGGSKGVMFIKVDGNPIHAILQAQKRA